MSFSGAYSRTQGALGVDATGSVCFCPLNPVRVRLFWSTGFLSSVGDLMTTCETTGFHWCLESDHRVLVKVIVPTTSSGSVVGVGARGSLTTF